MLNADIGGLEIIEDEFSEHERRFVAQQMHYLPMSEFMVAHLHFYRGHSLQQIASTSGISVKKIEALYEQALASLRRVYHKRFNRPKPLGLKAGLLTI